MPQCDGYLSSLIAYFVFGFVNDYRIFLDLGYIDGLSQAPVHRCEDNLGIAVIIGFVRRDAVVAGARGDSFGACFLYPVHIWHTCRVFRVTCYLDLDGPSSIRDNVFILSEYKDGVSAGLVDMDSLRNLPAADCQLPLPPAGVFIRCNLEAQGVRLQ